MLINVSAVALTASVELPAAPAGIASVEVRSSSKDNLDKSSTLTATAGKLSVPVPGYGVVTLGGQGQAKLVDAGAGADRGAGDGSTPTRDGALGDRAISEAGSSAGRPSDGCGCGIGAQPPRLPLMLLGALALALGCRGRRRR